MRRELREPASGCIRETNNREISIRESKHNRVILINSQNIPVQYVRPDNCPVLKEEGRRRCDFLVFYENEGDREIYIEFKGGDIEDAVQQILDTLNDLGERAANRRCFVVSSGSGRRLNRKKRMLDRLCFFKHIKKGHRINVP